MLGAMLGCLAVDACGFVVVSLSFSCRLSHPLNHPLCCATLPLIMRCIVRHSSQPLSISYTSEPASILSVEGCSAQAGSLGTHNCPTAGRIPLKITATNLAGTNVIVLVGGIVEATTLTHSRTHTLLNVFCPSFCFALCYSASLPWLCLALSPIFSNHP